MEELYPKLKCVKACFSYKKDEVFNINQFHCFRNEIFNILLTLDVEGFRIPEEHFTYFELVFD